MTEKPDDDLLRELDRSLDGWPDVPPAGALRAAVLAQTAAVVRRRRRRFGRIAWLTAAYAAGVVTAWFALRAQEPSRPPGQLEIAAVPRPATTTGTPHSGVQPAEPAGESPEELRGRVLGSPRPEQIRLLQMAGDQYLYQRADVAAAIDCYRQVLELTPREELSAPSADDSWLLAQLKLAEFDSIAAH